MLHDRMMVSLSPTRGPGIPPTI